jgi:hypothetical protein
MPSRLVQDAQYGTHHRVCAEAADLTGCTDMSEDNVLPDEPCETCGEPLGSEPEGALLDPEFEADESDEDPEPDDDED